MKTKKELEKENDKLYWRLFECELALRHFEGRHFFDRCHQLVKDLAMNNPRAANYKEIQALLCDLFWLRYESSLALAYKYRKTYCFMMPKADRDFWEDFQNIQKTAQQEKRTALLEAAIELIEELDLVQQLGEQIELQGFGPYLSDHLEGQLANLIKLKNILAELKKM